MAGFLRTAARTSAHGVERNACRSFGGHGTRAGVEVPFLEITGLFQRFVIHQATHMLCALQRVGGETAL